MTKITEDAPANSAGGGGVAGIGVGPQGEPPGPKSIVALIRRLRLKKKNVTEETFAGNKVFKVKSEFYHRCRLGKKKYHRYDKYVGSDELGDKIRQFGRENCSLPIIVQDENTGAMIYLRYGKNGNNN